MRPAMLTTATAATRVTRVVTTRVVLITAASTTVGDMGGDFGGGDFDV